MRGNRIGMVGQANMKRSNGSSRLPNDGVTRGMGELAHDILTLAELKFDLFSIDCRDGLKRMLVALALLLAATIVAAATVPIAWTATIVETYTPRSATFSTRAVMTLVSIQNVVPVTR